MELNVTILVQIALFLTLLVWLSRFLFTPLLGLIDERERRILQVKKDALDIDAHADKVIGQIQEKMLQAKLAGVELLENTRKNIAENQRQLLQKEKTLAHEQIEKAETELANLVVKATASLESESASMAKLILQKLRMNGALA